MKRFCCLLLAAAGPALAQQVYMRVPGTGYCDVTGASNETPVRITFDGSCGLTNGATILVLDVRGNLGANIHLSDASDTANRARKVSGLASGSFLLLDLNNNPVVGSGDYTGGGRIGLAAAYTMKAPPVVFLDGPAGPRTVALNDTANKKTTANPAYQALLNTSNNYSAVYGGRWGYEYVAQFPGSPTLTAALHWTATGDAAAKGVALFGMRNPDQMIGTTACQEDIGCGGPPSSIGDYPLQYFQTYYQAYSLMRGEMTPAERTHFIEFLLADLPWTEAGINYTGASLIKPDWKVIDKDTSGTVSTTAGSTTVTGSGTHFTTQVTVGDVVYIPHATENTFATPNVIDAIVSDTELTLSTPAGGNLSGVHWMAGPRWNETMYGFLWNQKHFAWTPLNGAGINVNVPSPYYGGLAGFYQSGDNNLSISRALGMYAIGLATCFDDPRGCLLASQAFEWMHDVSLPFCLKIWTGFSQAGNIYHQQRVTGPVLEWALLSTNSFESFPDPLSGTDMRAKLAMHPVYATIPQSGFLPNSEGALLFPSPDRMSGSLSAMAYDKNDTGSKTFKWWLENQYNYTAGALGYAGGAWAWEHFLLYEPTASAETPPTTRHFKDNNEARCIAIFGSDRCAGIVDVRRMSISRVDWSPQSTYVGVNAQGYACRDHCGDDTGGYFHIMKNGHGLLTNDSVDFMGGRPNRSYVEVGSVNNLVFYPSEANLPVLWTGGSADHMSIRMNIQPVYKPVANVTSLERQIIHAKRGSQDYVVDHVKGAFSTPQTVRGLQNFHLNECGTPSSTSCVTLDRTNLKAMNTQTGTRLSSRVIPVSGAGPVIVTTESGSETNGSYSGGNNRSFRWHVCPSTNGTTCTSASAVEWIVVHMPAGSETATLPAISHSVIGPFRTVEIMDPAAPKFVAFTANGATATTLTANTTHSGTGQYVVVGLEPGPYSVTRNGVSLGPPLQVAANDHSLTFDSLSGEIVVMPGPPPLTISTLTLPDAVIGRPYNGLVEAFSSTPPYQWDITAGALCAGHSLTPGTTSATITGAATTLGTCVFTVRVRDATLAEADSRAYTIHVVNPGPDPLQITTTQLPVSREGDAYSRQLLSSGGTAPVSWSLVAGTLCSGLTLHSSGLIDGTPTSSSACTFTVRVTDLGNVTVDRQFTLTLIPNVQSPLYISATEASESGAVVRFGRRGLAYDQACSVELRMGGPGGGLLQTLQSPLGPGRRVVVASGLPGGQTIYAGAACGVETAEASFETGFTPEAPRTVVLRFSSLVRLGVNAHDVVVSYGGAPNIPDSVSGTCANGECAVMIGTSSPLLYWQARFRDSGGATLALSAVDVKAPR